MSRELTLGEQMMSAFDLATARGLTIEQQATRIAELEAKLDRWQEAMDERDADLAEERAAHDATRADLARVTEALREQLRGAMVEVDFLHTEIVRIIEDSIATTARLHMTERALEQALEHLEEMGWGLRGELGMEAEE
jgi:chromosome segregation ATPase